MNTVFDIADADGRDYITPEDVTDSHESGCPADHVRLHVLQAIGRSDGWGTGRCWGVQDYGLTAFAASELRQ